MKQWLRPQDYYDENGALNRNRSVREIGKEGVELVGVPLMSESECPTSEPLIILAEPIAPATLDLLPSPDALSPFVTDDDEAVLVPPSPNQDTNNACEEQVAERIEPASTSLQETAIDHESLLLSVDLQQLASTGFRRGPRLRGRARTDPNTSAGVRDAGVDFSL